MKESMIEKMDKLIKQLDDLKEKYPEIEQIKTGEDLTKMMFDIIEKANNEEINNAKAKAIVIASNKFNKLALPRMQYAKLTGKEIYREDKYNILT